MPGMIPVRFLPRLEDEATCFLTANIPQSPATSNHQARRKTCPLHLQPEPTSPT